MRRKIEMLKPERVCFVGKGVYGSYSGRRELSWGFQLEPIADICEMLAEDMLYNSNA